MFQLTTEQERWAGKGQCGWMIELPKQASICVRLRKDTKVVVGYYLLFGARKMNEKPKSKNSHSIEVLFFARSPLLARLGNDRHVRLLLIIMASLLCYTLGGLVTSKEAKGGELQFSSVYWWISVLRSRNFFWMLEPAASATDVPRQPFWEVKSTQREAGKKWEILSVSANGRQKPTSSFTASKVRLMSPSCENNRIGGGFPG